jgi:hypothetical protein
MDDSDLTAKFEQVDTRLGKLEELIKSEGVTTRRHFDVVAEDLKSHVKLTAEGHSVLAEHVVEVKDGIETLEAGQGQLVLRIQAVESRVFDLEKTEKVVLSEVRLLAAKR